MPSTTAPRVGPPSPQTAAAVSGQAAVGQAAADQAAVAQAMPLPRQRPLTQAAPPSSSPTGPGPAGADPVGHRADHPEPAAGSPSGPVEADETGAWALVKASQAGDMTAFSLLFDRYYDVVFRYVLFRMGDRNLAEDITQETFLRALRRISSVSYQGRDIGAWFVTIARNLIFDHVKSSRYRLESTTAEIVELSPSTSGPEQQVLDGATNDELLRCVRKLNPDQQECIQLRFLQGLSVAETARMMDRNEGAVKALQHRAVRRLAQLLPEGIR